MVARGLIRLRSPKCLRSLILARCQSRVTETEPVPTWKSSAFAILFTSFILFYIILFFLRQALSMQLAWTHYLAQVGLELLTILLLQP